MQKYAKIKQQKMNGNSYEIRTDKAQDEVKLIKKKLGNWLENFKELKQI